MAKENEAAAEVDDGTIVWTLQKPVPAHGKLLRELRIPPPTAGHLMDVGRSPLNLDPASQSYTFDFAALGDLIGRLAKIPPSSVREIATQDLVGIGMAMSPFFIPALGSGPSETPST